MPALPFTPVGTDGDMTFYATREYFDQLVADINATQSGDRVLLVTMSYELKYQQIVDVTEALEQSALRGATVVLEIDANSFLEDTEGHLGPLFWRGKLPKRMSSVFQQTFDALKRLEAAGVSVVITNMPTHALSGPMIGRSHIKLSVINDKMYFGGCNLSDIHLDVMTSWHDAATADWLFELMSKRLTTPQTLQAFGTQDIRHTVTASTEIILDVGVKKQSAIYQEALDVIDRAQDWLVITCQFFPHSTTALHLKRAHERGVKVLPIFNHYKAHFAMSRPAQYGVRTREYLRMPHAFFAHELQPGSRYLHAKILASEKEALIGSHNYIPEGVTFGTAEIALHNKTATFSRAAARIVIEETGLAKRPDFAFLFD